MEITRGWFPWLLNANILSHFGKVHNAVSFRHFCGGNAVTNIQKYILKKKIIEI